jgi:hypothetical protein
LCFSSSASFFSGFSDSGSLCCIFGSSSDENYNLSLTGSIASFAYFFDDVGRLQAFLSKVKGFGPLFDYVGRLACFAS